VYDKTANTPSTRTDYRTVGGIVVPVTRRVYAADAEHRKIADPLLVSIDRRNYCLPYLWEWRAELRSSSSSR
jgi:hypothetical protein